MLRELYYLPWVACRIGVHFSFNGSATLTGTPRLAIGGSSILSGGGGYSEGSATRNFVGVRSKATQWDFVSGSPSYFNAGAFELVTKNGATITTAPFGSPPNAYFSADPTVRNVLVLDLAKVNAFSMNATLIYPSSSAGCQADVDKDTFYKMIHEDLSVSGYGTTGATSIATTWSILAPITRPDSLNFSWEKTDALFEFSEVRYKFV